MKDLKNYSTEELIDMLGKLEEELALRNPESLPELGDIFIEEYDECTITLLRVNGIEEDGICVTKISLSPEDQYMFVDDEYYDIDNILDLEKIPEDQKQEYTDKINKIIDRYGDYMKKARKSNKDAYFDCMKILNSEEAEKIEEKTTDGVE